MTPHLVIDARLYGSRHTGIGRYTKNLLIGLSRIPAFRKFKITLLVYPEIEDEIRLDLGNRFHYRITSIRHYSLQEQLFLPFILYSLRPTLVHFTHFNRPFFYFGKSVVTIHDLIKHFSTGSDTTTRTPWLYLVKHLAYRALTWWVIKTNPLIVPSNYWRDFIINRYCLPPHRITTTHEAVDPQFLSQRLKVLPPQKPHYLLYTGNLYPHKNVSVILEALTHLPQVKLKIIGKKNIFSDRLQNQARRHKVNHQVKFLGYLSDSQFRKIYQRALCLVHPSFYEGFSLTGLEAMALNCPVIAANSSCLPEIYGSSVIYFDPRNPQALAAQINKLAQNQVLRSHLIALGQAQVARYSWDKTARTTLSVYQNLISEK